MKAQYPTLLTGYEAFLKEKQKKLTNLDQKLSSEKAKIPGLNNKIQQHNENVRDEIHQKHEVFNELIETEKNKLSALKFLQNIVDGKNITSNF